MGRVSGRKRYKFGPVTVNFSATGFGGWRMTSWSVRIWRWSWNARSGKQRFDIPGPWTWESTGRKGRER